MPNKSEPIEMESCLRILFPVNSTTHLNVRYRSGYLEIMDLNSTNGTKVDGVKIPTNTWVKVSEDSVIKLGKAKLFTSKLEEE